MTKEFYKKKVNKCKIAQKVLGKLNIKILEELNKMREMKVKIYVCKKGKFIKTNHFQ